MRIFAGLNSQHYRYALLLSSEISVSFTRFFFFQRGPCLFRQFSIIKVDRLAQPAVSTYLDGAPLFVRPSDLSSGAVAFQMQIIGTYRAKLG